MTRIAIPLLVICGLAAAGPAHAGAWLQLAANPGFEHQEGPNGKRVEWSWFTSTSLGYAFPQGFMLGMQGLTARSGVRDDRSYAWGPKAGLLLEGVELTAAYLPYSRFFGPTTRREGAGFAINLGYMPQLSATVRAGLVFTYWSAIYSEENGVDLTEKTRSNLVFPLLTVAFDF